MKFSIIPNVITSLRLLAAVPLAWLLLDQQYQNALILAVAAGISDLADGFLAKRFGWVSRFGSIADPLADKLLMFVSFAGLAWHNVLPWWLLYLTLLRDLIIVAGATAYHFLVAPLTAEPTYPGKINTVLQIILVAAVLVDIGFSPVSPIVLTYLLSAVVILTVFTLVQYVWIWAWRTHERWGDERY